MHEHFDMWRKLRSIARRSETRRSGLHILLVRDPELVGIIQTAHRRRLDTEQSLERVFEKVKPILNRQSASEPPIRERELPAALVAKVAKMPDAEQRIRTIVEFKLLARKRVNHHKENP